MTAKDYLKRAALAACIALAMPGYLLYRLQCLIAHPDRAFSGWSQFYALFPGVSGEYLRAGFYKLSVELWEIDCQIQFGTILSRPQVRLHKGVSVGPLCSLGMVEIGRDTILGTGVHIPSGTEQHAIDRLDVPIKEQERNYRRITVGEDCWLGNGAIILADVGHHCVVGAGSVVTKPVEDYAIVAGNPAKVVRFRDGRILEA